MKIKNYYIQLLNSKGRRWLNNKNFISKKNFSFKVSILKPDGIYEIIHSQLSSLTRDTRRSSDQILVADLAFILSYSVAFSHTLYSIVSNLYITCISDFILLINNNVYKRCSLFTNYVLRIYNLEVCLFF